MLGWIQLESIESVCMVLPGAGVLRLHVPGMAGEVIIARCCGADGVDVPA